MSVWLAIRGDGQGGGDPQAVLDDPRVAHRSDPDVDICRWFGDRDHTFHAGSGVAWDVFLLNRGHGAQPTIRKIVAATSAG